MAKCHIYSNFRSLKSIPNGQKTSTNKISHAPYRYTLVAMAEQHIPTDILMPKDSAKNKKAQGIG